MTTGCQTPGMQRGMQERAGGLAAQPPPSPRSEAQCGHKLRSQEGIKLSKAARDQSFLNTQGIWPGRFCSIYL